MGVTKRDMYKSRVRLILNQSFFLTFAVYLITLKAKGGL